MGQEGSIIQEMKDHFDTFSQPVSPEIGTIKSSSVDTDTMAGENPVHDQRVSMLTDMISSPVSDPPSVSRPASEAMPDNLDVLKGKWIRSGLRRST
jgi:hypothetical protein